MRLIECRSHRMVEYEFDTDSAPRQLPFYAILSHRWSEDQEIDFGQYRDKLCQEKGGWSKIRGFCVKALQDGHRYAWIDTCCIDKQSSAELSEAINSMFRFYAHATTCYVYLADVNLTSSAHSNQLTARDREQIKQSKWFQRAWTLQELLAPTRCDFYDRGWRFLGSRNDLAGIISNITGIAKPYLRQKKHFSNVSIARRMSWASRRVCRRPEDRAYSLLGIFGVSMPLVYGEGARNAFLRLQHTIISADDDESIFAWRSESLTNQLTSDMLAPDLSCFAGCDDIAVAQLVYREAFEVTNKGLRIKLDMTRTDMFVQTHAGARHPIFLSYLNCQTTKPAVDYPLLGFLLAPHSAKELDDSRIHKYFRLGPLLSARAPTLVESREVYIGQRPDWLTLSPRVGELLDELQSTSEIPTCSSAIGKAVRVFHANCAVPYGSEEHLLERRQLTY